MNALFGSSSFTEQVVGTLVWLMSRQLQLVIQDGENSLVCDNVDFLFKKRISLNRGMDPLVHGNEPSN